MRIDAKNKDNGVVLHPDGKVIGDGVPQFKQTVEEYINSGVDWLIIDLAKVPLMDSSALGTVIAAFLKLQERNSKLVLTNAQKSILDVLAITKLDNLDTLPFIRICTAYELDGKTIDYFPGTIHALERVKPVYEEMPGWQTDISGILEYDKLPEQTIKYIEKLEELLSCPVNFISVGPERNQTIWKKPIL